LQHYLTRYKQVKIHLKNSVNSENQNTNKS